MLPNGRDTRAMDVTREATGCMGVGTEIDPEKIVRKMKKHCRNDIRTDMPEGTAACSVVGTRGVEL